MKDVSISELRAHLLRYLQDARHGEQINVTSKGISLATLSPPTSQADKAGEKLRKLAQTAMIHDVISPIDENWNASE